MRNSSPTPRSVPWPRPAQGSPGLPATLFCRWWLVTLWSIALQAPLSMTFSRPENELPFPSPADLPDPGSNSGLLHCRQILPESITKADD